MKHWLCDFIAVTNHTRPSEKKGGGRGGGRGGCRKCHRNRHNSNVIDIPDIFSRSHIFYPIYIIVIFIIILTSNFYCNFIVTDKGSVNFFIYILVYILYLYCSRLNVFFSKRFILVLTYGDVWCLAEPNVIVPSSKSGIFFKQTHVGFFLHSHKCLSHVHS